MRERLPQRLPGLERALARELDRRAIGHRIGERHAELDDVGAGAGQRREDLPGWSSRSGSPAMMIGDERRAVLGGAGGETIGDAGGHLERHPEMLADALDVLVAAAGEAEDDGLVLAHRRRELHHLREAVRAFERRDDALEPWCRAGRRRAPPCR